MIAQWFYFVLFCSLAVKTGDFVLKLSEFFGSKYFVGSDTLLEVFLWLPW